MPKSFTEISSAGAVVAPVAAKTTVINTGSTVAFLTTDELDDSLSLLSAKVRRAVLTSLYAIQPGQSKSLTAGTYNLDFSSPYSNTIVLLIEISKA